MAHPRVIGLAGWSGAGKTTLLVKLIPALRARSLRIATLKRAHHSFQVDHPGKDSYEHRQAGAGEVIISSAGRWVQMHENHDEPEATLADLLRQFSPCDLILVEGFKQEAHLKIEVFRAENGREALHPEDQRIIAVASDRPFPEAGVPVVDLNDISAIAELILAQAEPLEATLSRLEAAS